MSDAKKYILFCAQQSNFQTRSILIPYDEIMQCEERVSDLQVLRDNSSKNVEFEHKGMKYVVDQLLYTNVTWIKNELGTFSHNDQTPYHRIVNDFVAYADTLDYNCFIRLFDQVWRNDVIPCIASKGFNHVLNYCNFRNKTECDGQSIEIIEGFLVLETTNGREYQMPVVDTTNEMYQKYYGFSIDDSD